MAESSEQASLAAITAEIVSTYVSHNQVTTTELAGLISAVAGQLSKLGTEQKRPAAAKPSPAVPVRRSIQPDHLVCLICGKKQKVLKRHLAVEHGLTPDQYRRTFELGPDYPMAAPNYTQQWRELAPQIGLGRPSKSSRKRGKSGTGRQRTVDAGP